MFRILAVADYPVLLNEGKIDRGGIGDIDLILSCGDLPMKYLEMLRREFRVPLYYVRGNHDIRECFSFPDGCVDIHMQVVTEGGLTIAGLEGSLWYNGGQVQYTESEMAYSIALMRSRLRKSGHIDLFITHAPPRGINDANDPAHRGFRVYRKLIQRYRPAYLLHGHVHHLCDVPENEMTRFGETKVVNCCGTFVFELEK